MKTIYLCLIVLVVVACNNDKDPELSVEELLTRPENGWVQTSILATIPGTTTKVDVFNDPSFADTFKDCDKDNAIVFKADGKYSVESSLKCDSSEPAQLEVGTWQLSSDQKTVTFTPTGDVGYSATILEISETGLKADVTLIVVNTAVSATITLEPK
jgi:hypothetical protein